MTTQCNQKRSIFALSKHTKSYSDYGPSQHGTHEKCAAVQFKSANVLCVCTQDAIEECVVIGLVYIWFMLVYHHFLAVTVSYNPVQYTVNEHCNCHYPG